MAEKVRIEKTENLVTITVKTYRRGDFVHIILASLALILAAVVLTIGLQRGTLTNSWATPVFLIVAFAYGWLALTKAFNRRTLALDPESLSVSDGPWPSLAPRIQADLAGIGAIQTRSATRLTFPMISTYRVHHVVASGTQRALFRALADESEATRIRAALVAFLA